MPTSNYGGFQVDYNLEDGTAPVSFATQAVKVRDVTNSADLSDLTSDGAGAIAAGTLSVAVGTKIRFSFSITSGAYKGVCAFKEILTT